MRKALSKFPIAQLRPTAMLRESRLQTQYKGLFLLLVLTSRSSYSMDSKIELRNPENGNSLNVLGKYRRADDYIFLSKL